MKVRKFLVREYNDNKDYISRIVVPQGSIFLDVVALPDGITAYFTCPELEVPEDQEEIFYTLGPAISIPEDAVFVKLLDLVISNENGNQGVVVFPVFRKSDRALSISTASVAKPIGAEKRKTSTKR